MRKDKPIWIFFASLLVTIVLFSSCKRDIETALAEKPDQLNAIVEAQSVSTTAGCVEDQDNGATYDTLPRPTILGARLIGTPYSVATMQQASRNLYGTTTGITENKWYVRFKPADVRQLNILDSLGLDLFDYPLDYEVVQEGDYYDDGVTPAETIPWLYTVVPVNFVFPSGIQYELLQRMHVPTLAALEREAFRITSNPVPDTTCGGTVTSISTPQCPADQHWDYELNTCVPNSCPLGYHWDGVQYACVRDVTSPPPPSPTRQPSGTVFVFDDNSNPAPGSFVPVRNVEVIAKNFMKVERVFTNSQGQYFITKEFNKANIFIRTKNDQASIRALQRARLWQMLFPVEVHFGKFRGSLKGLTHNIDRNTNALSSGAKHWTAATAVNKVQEYYDWAAQQQIGVPPQGLKMLLTDWRNTGGSTPLFAKRF